MTTRGVGLSEEEFAERQVVRPLLAAHFIMWRTLDGPPLGEWFCECGLKFGLSDSAIDHQAAIVAAHTADLAAQVAAAWDEGVDAAFRGAVTRQNGDDVKRRNPYRTEPADPRTHGLNHAPLPEGTLLDPGFCAGCDALRAALSPAQPDTERGGGS